MPSGIWYNVGIDSDNSRLSRHRDTQLLTGGKKSDRMVIEQTFLIWEGITMKRIPFEVIEEKIRRIEAETGRAIDLDRLLEEARREPHQSCAVPLRTAPRTEL